MKTRTRNLLLACIAALFAALLYAHTAHFEFTWDDLMLVRAAGDDPAQWTQAFRFPVDRLYRPLRTILFMAENAAHAPEPAALFHSVNIALYAAACAAFFWFCAHMLRNAWWAAAAALMFAAHPAHAEVVASVGNGSADLLAALFTFSSLALITGPRTRARHAAALALFTLALLAKESTAVLPGVVFVLAFVEARRHGSTGTESVWRRAFKDALVFAAPVVLYAGVRFTVLDMGGQIQSWHGGSFISTILTTLSIVPDYARQLFIPVQQCPVYQVAPLHGATARVALGALLLTGSAAAGLACLRQRPIISLCIFWILFMWLPVSNIVPIAALRADRFLFLPSAGAVIGLAAALRAGAGALGGRYPKAAAPAVVAVLSLLLIWYADAARQASRPWHDSEALWERAVACAPDSPFAWNNYGNVMLHTRRPQQAEAAFNRSIACNPGFPHPYLGLAEVYGRQGRYGEALSALLKGKQLDPENPAFDCRLATANSLLHRPEQARAWYNSCIKLSREGDSADGAGR